MRACCMISNSTAIAEVFSRIDHKFDLLIPSVHLCTGMLARVWRKVSFQRHVRTWPLWKKTTRKWALRPQRVKVRRRATETSSDLVMESSTLACLEFVHRENCDGQGCAVKIKKK